MRVVWHATPWPFRLLAFPYCLFVYSGFLAQSTSVSDVRALHSSLYRSSVIFKICRPKFHIVQRALGPLHATPADQVLQENPTSTSPVAPDSSNQVPVSVKSAPVQSRIEFEGKGV